MRSLLLLLLFCGLSLRLFCGMLLLLWSFDKVGSVISSVGGCCPVRSCCLGGGPVLFLSPGSPHQVSPSFLASSQQVMPSELVFSRI